MLSHPLLPFSNSLECVFQIKNGFEVLSILCLLYSKRKHSYLRTIYKDKICISEFSLKEFNKLTIVSFKRFKTICEKLEYLGFIKLSKPEFKYDCKFVVEFIVNPFEEKFFDEVEYV